MNNFLTGIADSATRRLTVRLTRRLSASEQEEQPLVKRVRQVEVFEAVVAPSAPVTPAGADAPATIPRVKEAPFALPTVPGTTDRRPAGPRRRGLPVALRDCVTSYRSINGHH